MKYNGEGLGRKVSGCNETEMLRRKAVTHTRRHVYGRGTALDSMRKFRVIKHIENTQEAGEMTRKKSGKTVWKAVAKEKTKGMRC